MALTYISEAFNKLNNKSVNSKRKLKESYITNGFDAQFKYEQDGDILVVDFSASGEEVKNVLSKILNKPAEEITDEDEYYESEVYDYFEDWVNNNQGLVNIKYSIPLSNANMAYRGDLYYDNEFDESLKSRKKSLKEETEKKYKVWWYENTAGRDRRPITKEDLEDFNVSSLYIDDLIDFMEDIDYDLDGYSQDDIIEALNNKDWSDGSPIIYKIVQGRKIIYDDSEYMEELKRDLEDSEDDFDESLNESVKFDGIKFESKIPHRMRYKEYDPDLPEPYQNSLYWVTQDFFTKEDIEKFKKALLKTDFDKAYVTVRDLSSYIFRKDKDEDVFVIIDNETGDVEYGANFELLEDR